MYFKIFKFPFWFSECLFVFFSTRWDSTEIRIEDFIVIVVFPPFEYQCSDQSCGSSRKNTWIRIQNPGFWSFIVLYPLSIFLLSSINCPRPFLFNLDQYPTLEKILWIRPNNWFLTLDCPLSFFHCPRPFSNSDQDPPKKMEMSFIFSPFS